MFYCLKSALAEIYTSLKINLILSFPNNVFYYNESQFRGCMSICWGYFLFSSVDQDFAFTQSLMNRAILAHWLKHRNKSQDLANFELLSKRFPVAQHFVDSMYLTIKLQLSLFMVLGFMMNVFVYTKNIVSEKELKIKVSYFFLCVEKI